MNIEDNIKEDDNQIDEDGDQNQNLKKSVIKISKSKFLKIKQPLNQQLEQNMDEEDQENDENEGDDEDKSEDVDEDQDNENFDENNTSAQILPEDEENTLDDNNPLKKINQSKQNMMGLKKNSNIKKSLYNNKFKLSERNNLVLQSGTNISVNNSTHDNNNNDGINEEVEKKLLDSNSFAVYLKHRCTKYKKTILGFVNRSIVIYEITLNQEKEISFQKINYLELKELHEYDMSYVQMSTNLQNDKFAIVLDKKFMHIFFLNSNCQIITKKEEYLSQDQAKRYMNPIFWRDPFDKEKSEYFVYLDNTHLNCSICFLNLNTKKRQIVILTADKPRNFVQNIRWEGCIGIIGEGGSIFILESPRCYYWENFSYRFKGLEKNSQYIEKEDEFDVKEDDFEKKQLTEYEFDNLKTHYADFIFPAQEKIHSDGTYNHRDKNERNEF